MGAIMAAGLLDAGGRNATPALRSHSGYFRRTSVVALALFTQYWCAPSFFCTSLVCCGTELWCRRLASGCTCCRVRVLQLLRRTRVFAGTDQSVLLCVPDQAGLLSCCVICLNGLSGLSPKVHPMPLLWCYAMELIGNCVEALLRIPKPAPAYICSCLLCVHGGLSACILHIDAQTNLYSEVCWHVVAYKVNKLPNDAGFCSIPGVLTASSQMRASSTPSGVCSSAALPSRWGTPPQKNLRACGAGAGTGTRSRTASAWRCSRRRSLGSTATCACRPSRRAPCTCDLNVELNIESNIECCHFQHLPKCSTSVTLQLPPSLPFAMNRSSLHLWHTCVDYGLGLVSPAAKCV